MSDGRKGRTGGGDGENAGRDAFGDGENADGNALGDGESGMGDLFDELEELEDLVDTEAEREQVRETMRAAMEADQSRTFGRVAFGFDRSDAAEALLGALLFGIPMFVEGGTLDVGRYLSSHPVYFATTVGLTVGLVVSILYVADIQDVRVMDPILGIVPRKLLGVLAVSMGTALFMMTTWGQVDWSQPWLALCQVGVAWVPMAIGAALGDLLPG
jgi:uncharacterized membrane protein